MSPHPLRRRGPAVFVAAALALFGAPALATTASAADGDVTVNLININDWHGRIDGNTVKFAGTVEQLRAVYGDANSLVLSAGDNIGASLFPSASAQDQPAIDVLNALDVQASAVGNHEFDQGFAFLTDKVIGGNGYRPAAFPYLGANVYLKGTTTPALPEYAVFDVAGIQVAVIGAVTVETPSLVSPGGITTLDFGDPVDAVNRVANQIAGTVDVIVAEYHEGAASGTIEKSTLEDEVAKGGAFADIVTNTDADVDAIFTGHTHRAYAWDGPVPGAPGKTRPVVEALSYGEYIGQVVLNVNPTTDEVSSYTASYIKRTGTDDLTLIATYPRVAEVKAINDAALAAAAIVGNQPVGTQTADITTAYAGGSFVGGVWTPPLPATPLIGRDDRLSESTLGNYVANALRDKLSSDVYGGAQLSMVNPGGLRSELLYAATPLSSADADGRILYSEANGVLPFGNGLFTVDLTGANIKAILEEQWQPDGASRPFLHLGLSDNISVTQDPTRPRGQRITSVWIDGKPLNPTGTYRVGTFSFLIDGGDNFLSFGLGTNKKDSSLIDRDGWIEYLTSHQPSTPSFARRQVVESGMPTSLVAGQSAAFTLSKINLTSLGSPENTSVEATLVTAGTAKPVSLGTFPVTAGSAAISLTMPSVVRAPSVVRLVAQPSGTTVTIPAPRSAVSTTTVIRSTKLVRGIGGWMTVKVTSALPVTGRIEVRAADGSLVGAAFTRDGRERVFLRPWALPLGPQTVTVSYLGNAAVQPSSTTATVRVVRR